MDIRQKADQALEKEVRSFGNTAHVTVPKKWRDRRVLVLLLPKQET